MSWVDGVAAGAAAAVLLVARRRRWLTPAGLAAAAVVGGAVLLGAGAAGAGWLLFFFVVASAATEWRARREEGAEGEARPAGSEVRRTAAQVWANGGVAAACALVGIPGWLPRPEAAVLGALAAATADTLGTEVGIAAGRSPVRATTGRPAPPGSRGGVSLAGTLAGAAGAAGLGALAAVTLPGAVLLPWTGAGLLAGLTGSFADSCLGAASASAGPAALSGDAVNALATAVGAAAAWALLGAVR